MNGRICLAPSAQFMPTLKSGMCETRNPESLHRLPGERAPAAVHDGDRDDHRNARCRRPRNIPRWRRGRPWRSACRKPFRAAAGRRRLRPARWACVAIGLAQLIEGHRPRRGIGDVLRDRGRVRSRSHRAGHEAAPAAVRRGKRSTARRRDLRAGEIQIRGAIFQAVVGHGDGVGIEGIGLDDVRAGFEVLAYGSPR